MIIHLLLLCVVAHLASSNLMHTTKREQTFKNADGERMPGLMRPLWVMDREFYPTETSPARKDRIYLKLQNNFTVQLLGKKRPWLELWKKRTATKVTNIFASNKGIKDENLYDSDGTWSLDTTENKLPVYKIVIETNEGPKEGRFSYEARCSFGRMDGYAAFFQRGTFFRYKGSMNGMDLMIGKFKAGTFSLRSNIHRPILSKDFLAIEWFYYFCSRINRMRFPLTSLSSLITSNYDNRLIYGS